MRVRIVRGRASNGARELSRATGIPRLRLVRTKFRPRNGDVLINWGSCSPPVEHDGLWLNHPASVKKASNKRTALVAMKEAGVPVPEFTSRRQEAEEWLDDGSVVICRRFVRGSAGAGIEVVQPDGGMPYVPLYTKYFKGYDEYRVHVFTGIVIDAQQKKVRNGIEEPNYYVRSYGNGWVFCRDGVSPPQCVTEAAVNAVSALGLTFGAVDVKYNRHYDSCAVLEVNTAPGLEGSTIHAYAEQIKLFLED